MFSVTITNTARSILAIAAVLAVGACSETTTSPTPEASPSLADVKVWEAGVSVSWNKTARDLITARGVNTPAGQSRVLTYLSVAQYNAIVAAEDNKDEGVHASPAAAAAAASHAVLKSMFLSDGTMLDAKLAAQRAAERWSGDQNRSFAEGEKVGREVAADVLAYAATDGVG